MELIIFENQNKFIGYLIAAIVAYDVHQIVLPFLIWRLVGGKST